jgi:hypothetical protein
VGSAFLGMWSCPIMWQFCNILTVDADNAASQQKTSCVLRLRRAFSGSQTALRRTAFLDVSSLNFGGAKSTAVFLYRVRR